MSKDKENSEKYAFMLKCRSNNIEQRFIKLNIHGLMERQKE